MEDRSKVYRETVAKLEEIAVILQSIPPSEWSAQQLIRFGKYFMVRGMMGGHKQAVKRQNGVIAKVRRAMGYAYPKDDRVF